MDGQVAGGGVRLAAHPTHVAALRPAPRRVLAPLVATQVAHPRKPRPAQLAGQQQRRPEERGGGEGAGSAVPPPLLLPPLLLLHPLLSRAALSQVKGQPVGLGERGRAAGAAELGGRAVGGGHVVPQGRGSGEAGAALAAAVSLALVGRVGGDVAGQSAPEGERGAADGAGVLRPTCLGGEGTAAATAAASAALTGCGSPLPGWGLEPTISLLKA